MPMPSRSGTRICSVTTSDVAGRPYRSQAGADGSFDTPPATTAPVVGQARVVSLGVVVVGGVDAPLGDVPLPPADRVLQRRDGRDGDVGGIGAGLGIGPSVDRYDVESGAGRDDGRGDRRDRHGVVD